MTESQVAEENLSLVHPVTGEDRSLNSEGQTALGSVMLRKATLVHPVPPQELCKIGVAMLFQEL